MKMEIFAVKDRALNAFMRPFFAQTIGQAIRSFSDEINRPGGHQVGSENHMNMHPEDYDLWHLGSFNDATGTFSAEPDDRQDWPRQVAIGKNVLRPPNAG